MKKGNSKYGYFLLLSLVIASGCSKPSPSPSLQERAPATAVQKEAGPIVLETTAEPGLTFHLEAGTGAKPASEKSPVPTEVQPLDEKEASRLLEKLPPLKISEGGEGFVYPAKSPPPPQTGEVILEPFPPTNDAKTPETRASEPLQVLRFSPQGEVPMISQLTVTFSQPMVDITSLSELEKQAVPVKLTPEPAGKWRWLGTKTLLFEAKYRFPMATHYTVEVPAGVRSVAGGALQSAVHWKFSTPPPKVVQFYPEKDPVRTDALLFAVFDQKVTREEALKAIHVSGPGKATLRLGTAEEIAEESKDERMEHLLRDLPNGRWMAFRTAEPFPPDSKITVAVGPGVPSAEGPRKTEKPQGFDFRTYGPFRVAGSESDWEWTIRFSNPIDVKKFKDSLVSVRPKPESLSISAYGDSISVEGAFEPRTAYQVTLDASLTDQFGQTLSGKNKVSFKTGPSDRHFSVSSSPIVVLDPTAGPFLPVYSAHYSSLNVEMFSVAPEDWNAFKSYLKGNVKTVPGKKVFSRVLSADAVSDDVQETRLDLTPALNHGRGQVLVSIKPQPRRDDNEEWIGWVQVTDIALDAFVDDSKVVAWATSFKDGSPLQNVEVELLTTKAMTDAQGLAQIPLPEQASNLLIARLGDDVALLPRDAYLWGANDWKRTGFPDRLLWHVFDDRKLYKPGEEVHIKGWLRSLKNDLSKDDLPKELSYRLTDSRGNVITSARTSLNDAGGFDLALKLPRDMNLGPASLSLVADGAGPSYSHWHSFRVEEFRRPDFEVKVEAMGEPFLLGTSFPLKLFAKYYTGGGLPGAPITWNITSSPSSYTPPNRDDFIFGEQKPFWDHWRSQDPKQTKFQSFNAFTDPEGKNTLNVRLAAMNPPQPMNIKAEGTVQDLNRQAWTDSEDLLIHPSSLYVGLKSGTLFVQKGEPLEVEAVVTDLEGGLKGRDISIKATRLTWTQEEGEWKETETDPQTCLVTSQDKPVSCRFETKEAGRYRIQATIKDDQGRPNQSSMILWAAGEGMNEKNLKQGEVKLLPDKKEYQPGDTARLMVLSPFYPAQGLLTERRLGILKTERFQVDGPSTTLAIKIGDDDIPNLNLQIDLVGSVPKPVFATGTINLTVPPFKRTLSVSVKPQEDAVEPGGETSLDLDVKDADGKPVSGAETAVVVVDEAILALLDYQIPNPLSTFYGNRGPLTSNHYLQSLLLLDDAKNRAPIAKMRSVVAAKMEARSADFAPPPAPMEVSQEGPSGTVKVRSNFDPLALFSPAVTTDDEGRARLSLKLPDSLTRYRIVAVSVSGADRFGRGESTLTARRQLSVRPSPPRFLHRGDRFDLAVQVQNESAKSMTVDLAARSDQAALTSGSGRRVVVPGGDRVEVRLPVEAKSPGQSQFQVIASSGSLSDAAAFYVPVFKPALMEDFATYGQVDEGFVTQSLRKPSDLFPEVGGLEISTSSTSLQNLTDAMLYLVRYPFECSEQIASRLLAIAALNDVLAAFHVKDLPSPEEISSTVARDIGRLQRMQNYRGGFGFWKSNEAEWPYLSVHVAHALARLKEKGFDVPEPLWESSKKHLKAIEEYFPSWYGRGEKSAIAAYSLYVRSKMGDPDPDKARQLIRKEGLDHLSLEAVGWLLAVFSDSSASGDAGTLLKYLNNRVVETASTAHFAESHADDGNYLLLVSDRRADAVVLDAFIAADPKSDLIPKLVQGLLAQRKAGRWSSTQENAFALLALERYFSAFERETPDFLAQVWLGGKFAGEHLFQGHTNETDQVRIPMTMIPQIQDGTPLLLSKKGPGRLYYRIALNYAPANPDPSPVEAGFTVERAYEPIDDAGDVRRDADGVWHIKAGSRVRIHLSLAATSRRYHVALVDPMPAGFEALNPDLQTTGSLPHGPTEDVAVLGAPGMGGPGIEGHWWLYARPWFEHQNLRDDRSEVFASLLWEGVHHYSYVARATTLGHFTVPPPKAEEMYHPETFGRGAVSTVTVEQ